MFSFLSFLGDGSDGAAEIHHAHVDAEQLVRSTIILIIYPDLTLRCRWISPPRCDCPRDPCRILIEDRLIARTCELDDLLYMV